MKAKRWVVLHAERVGQLEKMAKVRETTIAGTVEGLIADRVAAGEIPAGFDGFKVERQGDEVRIRLDGVALVPIPTTDAAQLAADMVAVASRSAGTVTLRLSDGSELTVRRNSPGGLTIAASTARFGVSTAMLKEIAAQLLEIAQ